MKGFSLVEVVVALVLLSIGGTAILSLSLTSSTRLRTAWTLQIALSRASEVADSLSAVGSPASGELTESWGRLTWGGAGGGRFLVRAFLAPESSETPDIAIEVVR